MLGVYFTKQLFIGRMSLDGLVYLCFDLGGTYTKYAIITQGGKLLVSDQYQTGCIVSAEEVMTKFTQYYFDFIKKYNIQGVGFSCHGIVNIKKGYIACGSPYVKVLENYPLVDYFKQKTGVKNIVIENDVNAAALGERLHWQEKKFKNYVFLTLGTSIGGAIIINDELYRGYNNAAGEFGYIITNYTDKDSQSMIPGAWESYASAKTFLQMYCDAAQKPHANVSDLKQKLSVNNPIAIQVLNDYLERVIPGLISLAHVLSPQAIIIGGAISEDLKIMKMIQEKFYLRVMSFYRAVKIFPAHYGNKAGLLGAVCLLNNKKNY